MNKGKITIGNVCFLLDKKNNTVLLLERLREPMKDMLTGVGGKTNFEEDIYDSCVREVKEETGFDARNLQLKGIVKTILEGHDSSWILFVYTCSDFIGEQIVCPEGDLKWVDISQIYDVNLIGFIKEILPFVLNENAMIEGTIKHDMEGKVLKKTIRSIESEQVGASETCCQ